MSALAVVFFFLADRLYPAFARAFGSRAAIRDPTGLPVLVFMVSLFLLFAQPVVNGMIRHGRNRGRPVFARDREPAGRAGDGAGEDGRVPQPAPERLQEILFYTHPSVERRVRRAMEWKATHPAS